MPRTERSTATGSPTTVENRDTLPPAISNSKDSELPDAISDSKITTDAISSTTEMEKSGTAEMLASATTPPFTIFTQKQRWLIVGLASLAAIFGPISSNIYVPAIPQITADFARSTQDINLTLTIYLIFQALSPSLLAGISDSIGRRPILLICLSVYVAACIGIALTPSSAYWLLMLLRAVQSTGGSPILGTGSATIGDISTPDERGKYMGLFQGVAMVGPAFGPVLGGILVQYLSWRWIFWVLAILCSASLIFIFFLMPETLRGLVGNGSHPPPLLNMTPSDWIRRSRSKRLDAENQDIPIALPEKKKFQPWAPFQMLLFPEVLMIMWVGSTAFACMFASLTVYSSILADDYHYNDVKIGLCYLAQGGGSLVTGIFGGQFHDRNFRRWKTRLNFEPKHPRDLDGFPIERVRFSYFSIYASLFLAATVGYGWALDKTVNIAVPLVMNFFIGFGSQLMMQTCSLILVDMFPANAGAVMASYNLVRCAMSAIVAAVVDPMINAVGLGWTFVILAAICSTSLPVVLLLQLKGPALRLKRHKKWRVKG